MLPGPDEDSNLDPSPLPDLDSESCFPAREEEEEEEERWLDALEKGELDDNGELKKEVDESLLTARQVRVAGWSNGAAMGVVRTALGPSCGAPSRGHPAPFGCCPRGGWLWRDEERGDPRAGWESGRSLRALRGMGIWGPGRGAPTCRGPSSSLMAPPWPPQKALLHKQQSQPLLELPMGYKTKEMTEEMLVKREERARKRRLQAAKKAEENKNQTIERLTKTNKAKVKTLRERRAKQAPCPVVHYCNAADRITVSFPAGMALPLLPTPAPAVPPPALCGVSGCSNHKRYSCSRTGLPLCSLACYKKNLRLQEAAA